jgi:hypothetical protein
MIAVTREHDATAFRIFNMRCTGRIAVELGINGKALKKIPS